jgi:hypothetical protein
VRQVCGPFNSAVTQPAFLAARPTTGSNVLASQMNHRVDTVELACKRAWCIVQIPVNPLAIGRLSNQANDLVPSRGQEGNKGPADQSGGTADGYSKWATTSEPIVSDEIVKRGLMTVTKHPLYLPADESSTHELPDRAGGNLVLDVILQSAAVRTTFGKAVCVFPSSKRSGQLDVAKRNAGVVIAMFRNPTQLKRAELVGEDDLLTVCNALTGLEYRYLLPGRNEPIDCALAFVPGKRLFGCDRQVNALLEGLSGHEIHLVFRQ